MTISYFGTKRCTQAAEPPYAERHVRWCERTPGQLMTGLLLDFGEEGGQGLREVRPIRRSRVLMRRCFRRFSGFWRLRGRCRGGKSTKGLINLSRKNAGKQTMSNPRPKSKSQWHWRYWAMAQAGNSRSEMEEASRPSRVIF